MKIRNETNISCLVKHYFERCKIEFRIKCTKILHQHIPCGLVARIRRFHRRGRGSIPRKGVLFVNMQISVLRARISCHDNRQ